MISKKNIILTIVILLLAFGNIALLIEYFDQLDRNQQLRQELKARQANGKIINFLNIFIEKVLKTDREVSFEDRLKLENAIRDLNDPEVLSQWEKFTSGKDEEEIQREVKNLLELLINKISY